MKAVIMAGGEGTRLRPLTCDIPKPMARLCGRPVIDHIIELLSKNGVDEAVVTLRYLPEEIRDHFRTGEYMGVKLTFSVEDKPLGTAGGVKNALGDTLRAGEELLVISGDAMCDLNLAAVAGFHREKNADATLVLSRVGDPREYGLVVTDASGAVKGFVEKPGWAQAVTDAVNTGIYVIGARALSMIERERSFDFAKDLFPLMLSRGMRVYGVDAEGYWCDIGDIGAYTSCQFDMLDGRVDCRIEGKSENGIRCKDRIPAGNFTLIPPVYIGSGVRIASYAQIGPFAVIDDDCTVGMGATVKHSVLLPGAYVGERSELRGALVCKGASLKKRAGMYEGSVAGSGSVIGADACVSPGVRIWPGKVVEDGARAAANLKTGSTRHGLFDDDGISGELGADLTPERCARLGTAAGGIFDNARIGVGCDGSPAAKALKSAVSAGVLSSGAEVCDFDGSFESLFSFAVNFFDLSMGIFVRMSGSRAVVELIGAGGLGIGRAAERKIEAAVSTGELRRCCAEDYGEPTEISGVRAVYQRALTRFAPKGFEPPVSVRSQNREIQKLLTQVLRGAGAHIDNGDQKGARIHIDAAGRHASVFCGDGAYLSPVETLTLCCVAAFENGEDVALPYSAPRVIDAIAKAHGRRVLRYLECPADDSDRAARALAATQSFVRDGLECALRVLSYAAARGISLSQLRGLIPPFAVSVKAVTFEVNPGLVLRSLRGEGDGESGEGVLLTRGAGRVLISPLKRGTGVRIIAEAADMEAAGELCADAERQLRGNLPGSLSRGGKTIDNAGKKS